MQGNYGLVVPHTVPDHCYVSSVHYASPILLQIPKPSHAAAHELLGTIRMIFMKIVQVFLTQCL